METSLIELVEIGDDFAPVYLVIEVILEVEDADFFDWGSGAHTVKPWFSASRGKISAFRDNLPYRYTEEELNEWEYEISKAQQEELSKWVDSQRSRYA